jgi:hypothetical protein
MSPSRFSSSFALSHSATLQASSILMPEMNQDEVPQAASPQSPLPSVKHQARPAASCRLLYDSQQTCISAVYTRPIVMLQLMISSRSRALDQR